MNTPEDMVEVWFTEPGGHTAKIVERLERFIFSAHKQLDIAVYNFTHDWLKDDIRKSIQRGVKVRILMEQETTEFPGSDHEYYASIGAEVRLDTDLEGLMHHKFAIADRSSVLTGSFNWTRTAAMRHRDNFLIVRHAHVVQAYSQEFERVWLLNAAGEV